jgi:hypothetical protein
VEREDYLRKLYPLQDAVLAAFSATETDFYLTGGTAASRGYLDHRFSWNLVRWNEAPPVEQFLEDLHRLGEELLLLEP